MRSLFSLCLSALLTLTILFNTTPAYAASLATLPGLGNLFAGESPALGLQSQQLSPCPETPNCVLSQNADEAHAIDPIPFTQDKETAHDLLLKVLSVVPRTTVIEDTEDYVRVEFETNLMGFIDDGEFYFPENESLIHVRSASRMGESDLNLNHRRIEQIRFAMADLEA